MDTDDNNVQVTDSDGSPNDWEDKYRRALADYQNLNRQHSREREGFIKYANQNLITELLPVVDHLVQAQSHLRDQGIELVIKEINGILDSYQIEPIIPQEGDEFDHAIHECVEVIKDDEKKPEVIAKIISNGYRWKSGPVIRHAQVVVYKKEAA